MILSGENLASVLNEFFVSVNSDIPLLEKESSLHCYLTEMISPLPNPMKCVINSELLKLLKQQVLIQFQTGSLKSLLISSPNLLPPFLINHFLPVLSQVFGKKPMLSQFRRLINLRTKVKLGLYPLDLYLRAI